MTCIRSCLILRKVLLQLTTPEEFILGVKMASRETENNAYATFWGEKTKSIMICYGIFWRGQ